MIATTIKVYCKSCAYLVCEISNADEDKAKECPKCGSLRRFHLTWNPPQLTGLKSLSWQGSKSNYGHKGIVGPSYSKSLNRYVFRAVSIEKSIDRYSEIIVDPETGQVLHHCDEPLSKHQGHGSAKKRPSITQAPSHDAPLGIID
jgi:hypothetical protein